MSRINVNEIVGVGNTHVQILSGLIGDASQLTFPPNIVSFSPDYLEDAAEVNANIIFLRLTKPLYSGELEVLY